jgi:hypothetical protein
LRVLYCTMHLAAASEMSSGSLDNSVAEPASFIQESMGKPESLCRVCPHGDTGS